MTGDNVLCKNWYLYEKTKISSHAHKTESWYLLEVLFKICDEHPRPFYMGVGARCMPFQ